MYDRVLDGETDWLPLVAFVPVQPPDALQLIGEVPEVLQESVRLSPSVIVVREAEKFNEGFTGAGFTVTVTDFD